MRHPLLSHVHKSFQNNWECLLNNPLGELAGSLGDLGTLLPVMVAMSVAGEISLPSTLIFSGIWNVLSGSIFGIPVVVQPMKAVAAVALARGLTCKETMGAGIGVAVIVLLLSLTGLLARVSALVPMPIIKGIQVGAGLTLALNAGSTLQQLDLNGDIWYDNLFWSIGAFIILYGTCRWPKRVPFAILVFVIGVLFAAVQLAKSGAELPHFGVVRPLPVTIPSPADFATGFGTAGLGQVPLTILNSVIAVTYLSRDLLPEQPAPSVTALGVSVGVMNLVGCWFGAMPVCHGEHLCALLQDSS
jgi:predicted benzoate:H+ symporter BenE